MDLVAIIFVVCTAAYIGAGLVAARHGSSSANDYLLADRSQGTLVTSLSVSGSDVSGWVLLGLVGMSFKNGLSVIWVLPSGLLGYFLIWGLVAKKLHRQSSEHESKTFPEELSAGFGLRTSASIRFCASLVIVVFLTLYLSAQFNACGKAFHSFFDLPYELGVLAGIPIMLPYIIVAGMRGVGWSEFVQALLIAVAVVIVPLIALGHAGGPISLYKSLESIDPSLTSWTAGRTGNDALLLVGFWLSIGLCYPGQPQILTRFMAAKDEATLASGRWFSIGWFLLVAGMSVLLGWSARVSFAEVPTISSDPEQILPVLARMFLPTALVGVVLAAIICAIMNSSMVFTILTTIIADFAALTGKRVDRFSGMARTITGLLIVGSAAAMAILGERSVFKVVLDAWGVLGASFAPAILYKLWSPHPRGIALLLGMITGCVSAIAWNGTEYQMLASLTVGATTIAATHFLTPATVLISDAEEGAVVGPIERREE